MTIDTDPMIIDVQLPEYDVGLAVHKVIDADPAATFAAARHLDFLTVRTPLLDTAMWLRGLPDRLRHRTPAAAGEAHPGGRCWPARLAVAGGAGGPGGGFRRGRQVLAGQYRMAGRARPRSSATSMSPAGARSRATLRSAPTALTARCCPSTPRNWAHPAGPDRAGGQPISSGAQPASRPTTAVAPACRARFPWQDPHSEHAGASCDKPAGDQALPGKGGRS